MKHLYIVTLLLLFTFQSINAQVLWSDDFDSHPVGLLSTDPTGATSGCGGWHVKTTFGQIQIVPESGRGNILAIGWVQNLSGLWSEYCTQENIDVLWNARNKSNNILKFEFETQAWINSTNQSSFHQQVYVGKNNITNSQFWCRVFKNNSTIQLGILMGSNIITYYNDWIKVEIYLDYTTNTIHYYIPGYGYRTDKFNAIELPDRMTVYGWFAGSPNPSQISIKMDNMKISAIPALPSYILNIEKILASKFNVFPNPASDIVTIIHNENIGIEQIEVYDINGKNIKSQNYSSQNEIQLNISDLAAGTYMFHIKTNQGTAVKKVVKK